MITQKLFLYFPKSETEKPIVYHLVKDHDLMINIFRAKVTPEEEGYLVLDVTGKKENIDKALEYIRSFNVRIQEKGRGIFWDKEKCVMCSQCTAHCPTAALHIAERGSMEVDFNEDLCVECMACIKVCPYSACSSVF